MMWFNLRRDGLALVLLALALVMIAAGLGGHSRIFGYSVALFIGTLAGLGFVRRRDRRTWWPPMAATVVLLASLAGAFAFEATPVTGAETTTLGFQRGMAFVIYGVWLPAFLTLGVTYVRIFDRLEQDEPSSRTSTGESR